MPSKGTFEHGFPFPVVGYVYFPGGYPPRSLTVRPWKKVVAFSTFLLGPGNFSGELTVKLLGVCLFSWRITSWWFQPLWKICSSNWIISPSRGENKKDLSCHHPDYDKVDCFVWFFICLSPVKAPRLGQRALCPSPPENLRLKTEDEQGVAPSCEKPLCWNPLKGDIPNKFPTI